MRGAVSSSGGGNRAGGAVGAFGRTLIVLDGTSHL